MEINQINQQLEAEIPTDQQLAFFRLKEKLFKEKEKLMGEQIRLANLRAGQIYGVEEIATGDTKYIGLTEQGSAHGEDSFEVRFGQHGRSAVNIFKTADLFHIYMAGKIAEHVAKNGLIHVSTEVVRSVFRPKLLHEGMFAPRELQELETRVIQEYVSAGDTIFNTLKRPDVVRSCSRSSRDESVIAPVPNVIERMRKASHSAVDPEKRLAEL